MKKSIVILLIALIVPVTLFAGVLDFSIGVDAKYRPSVYDKAVDCYDFNAKKVDMSKFDFKATDLVPGFAADAKILVFNVNATADIKNYSFYDEADAQKLSGKPDAQAFGSLDISGFAGAGLSFDIFFIRLGLGAGYQYKFGVTYEGNEADPYFRFKSTSFASAKEVSAKFDKEFAQFKEATFDVRLSADVVLGKLSAGLYVLLPTDLSIADLDFAKAKANYMGYLFAAEGGLRVMWHF